MFLQQYHDLFQGQVVVLDEVGVTIPDEILVESVWLWQMIEQVLPAKEADHIASVHMAYNILPSAASLKMDQPILKPTDSLLLTPVENLDGTLTILRVLHYANQCPHRNEGEQQGTNLCTSGTRDILANWMLLDNQSTIDLFCSAKLLKNIRRSSTRMNVRCNNAGAMHAHHDHGRRLAWLVR
jgi:hypothetical protein